MDNQIDGNSKKIEKRFYLLISLIVLSLILGVILLFQKSPKTIKEKLGDQAFSFFGDKKMSFSKKGIVILNVNGVIQFGARGLFDNSGVENLVEKINQYAKNGNVKGMILRINSPGGTIGAVQELYNAVKNFRKQGKIVIASMADIAASGGYYIAAACDKIYANPGTITGSIGVIIYSPSFKGLFNKIGISYNVFKSGKYKDMLASHRDVSPEERELLQSLIDDAYKQFYNDVKNSRKMKDETLKMYADGRIFSGNQGKSMKFIDELGDLKTAVKALGIQTGLGEEPDILTDKMSPLDMIFTMLGKKKSLTEELINLHTDNNINIFYLYMPL